MAVLRHGDGDRPVPVEVLDRHQYRAACLAGTDDRSLDGREFLRPAVVGRLGALEHHGGAAERGSGGTGVGHVGLEGLGPLDHGS
jgi:hypothetical protein